MKITAAQLFEYDLPLKRPIGPADRPETNRSGLLIRIENENGLVAWGEAAPLKGFSSETPAQSRADLASRLGHLVGHDVPEKLEQLDGGFERWLGKYDLCASARCAIEMAVLNLSAVSSYMPLSGLLSKHAEREIPVNGLISGSLEEAVETAQRLVSEGFATLKLKVGRADLDSEISTVRTISEAVGGKVALRLDANRAWSLEWALEFARGINACEIEYIEEPLLDVTALKSFAEKVPLPIALDETTREINPDEIPAFDFASAIVLKPTLLGGLERAAAFARTAEKSGLKTVITSTFESPVGIAALAHFAAAHGTANCAAGLETLSWLDKNLLTSPYAIERGRLKLSKVSESARTVDSNLIRKIDIEEAGHE